MLTNSSPSASPCSSPERWTKYVATYNVSPQAPGPHSQGSEVEDLVKGFVAELKRVKDKGVIVSANLNGQTAVITIDAPNGL